MFPYAATIIGLAVVGIMEDRKEAAQKKLVKKNALKIIDKPLAKNTNEKRG